MPRRLTLAAFVARHPPLEPMTPAPAPLLETYADRVPKSLLELWRAHGLGVYGQSGLRLIDPREWQEVLDRWIVSPADQAKRVPIALTPFGHIVYYRKLGPRDEDVACLDPHTREMDVLAYSLDEFFVDALCDDETMDLLTDAPVRAAAGPDLGELAAHEVYEVDESMLAIEMLVIRKVDALEMHRRLRGAVDGTAPASAFDASTPLLARIPSVWRERFEALALVIDNADPAHPAGVWLNESVDRLRLLLLDPDGSYELLYWHDDPRAGGPVDIRHNEGSWTSTRHKSGDVDAVLEMTLDDDSLGSDENDADLVLMTNAGRRMLLQTSALDDIAQAIHWNSRLRHLDAVFFETTLHVPVQDRSDGIEMPAWRDLPPCLRERTPLEPRSAVITRILRKPDDDDDEWLVRLDHGEDLGLGMNMPLCSGADDPKGLMGWVASVKARTCEFRVRSQTDDAGNIVNAPEVGDRLVTRDPAAGPMR